MSKHTPGPWEAWNSIGRTTLSSWRIGERNTTQGVVLPIATVSNEDYGRSGDERASNARLIAAAPELLAALKQLAEIGSAGIIERRETGKPIWSTLDAVNEIATAAIAKATGTTPEQVSQG